MVGAAAIAGGEVVGGGLVAAGVTAGDQDSGEGPVTGQPPTGLRVQRSRPAGLPTQPTPAEEAGEVDGDQQLGPDSTGLGQPATLQGPAGQLGQGVRGPLATKAGVVGALGAGQRFQGGQHRVASLGLQQPIHRHHAVKGRRQPQPPALMAPLGRLVGTLGVNDLAQVGDGLAQPRWVQLAGQLEQDRFGLGSDLIGQVVGAVGQHPGMGRGDHPVNQSLSGPGQGAGEQRPGGPDAASGRIGAHPEPLAQPGGGRSWLLVQLGPGRPPSVHPGQLLEPLAFQAVGQLPQGQDPLGPDHLREAVQVTGGQGGHVGGQRGQVVRLADRRPDRRPIRRLDRWPIRQANRTPACRLSRMYVRVHVGQSINPTPEHNHHPEKSGQRP